MLLSHHKRFIFIHIYKNAGSSITNALLPFAMNEQQNRMNRLLRRFKTMYYNPQPYPTHIKASEIAKRLGPKTFDSFFSFAIVRNPWDWQVSLYTYMLKTPTHFHHDLVKKLGSFDNYIKWRCSDEGGYELQKDFIYSEDGKLLVDFVGKYENLEADFQKICSKIGISTSLPRLNVSKTRPYQEYYTEETIELVGRTFATDISLFGYGFQDNNQSPG